VVKIPVIVSGRMEIPELAEKALEEGLQTWSHWEGSFSRSILGKEDRGREGKTYPSLPRLS